MEPDATSSTKRRSPASSPFSWQVAARVTAASSVRCDPKTIFNTAKRDPAFAERLALAENASELLHIENINKAGREVKYWRASAWMLERLHPDRFGKSSPDTIVPSQIAALIVQIAEIIIQEIPAARYRTEVLKRLDRLLVDASSKPYSNPSPIFSCSNWNRPHRNKTTMMPFDDRAAIDRSPPNSSPSSSRD